MADFLESRPGFRDIKVRFVDMTDGTWAEKVVVVNADGTPIAGGGGGGGTQYAEDTASAPAELLMMAGVVRSDAGGTFVSADGDRTELQVDASGNLRVNVAAGGSGGGVVTQGARDATSAPWKVESFVGVAAIDPRSIRALTIADVVDVGDRAGRALGVVASITAVVHVDDNAGSLTVDSPNLDVALSTRLKPADTLTAVTTVTSLTQMNGVAIQMGSGVRTAGTQRVTVATDDVVPVTGAFFQATQPVSIAAAVDISDRAARLIGDLHTAAKGTSPAGFVTSESLDANHNGMTVVVFGSGGAYLQQTPANFNTKVEVAVGAALIDPRSIRALTSSDVVDISDRAARENGRVRIWDGVDEATVLPVRTQPATTEKVLLVGDLPIRTATYGSSTITITPTITVGVKELLALWYTGGTKDIYIVEIWATGIVTTASTAGRTTIRVSTITTAPTGGTDEAAVDVAGAGASAMTNRMRVKTGGGAIGATFIRKLVWTAAQPLNSRFSETIFTASNPGNGLIMRGGVGSGFSIDLEREVAHTALVDLWTVGVRWLEL